MKLEAGFFGDSQHFTYPQYFSNDFRDIRSMIFYDD